MGLTAAFLPLQLTDFLLNGLSPVLFLFLKIYSHFMVYRKVKYHDEGNAFVSRSEFFAIHITFSMIEAWISYLLMWSAFVSVVQYIEHEKESGHVTENGKIIQAFGITAHVLILVELIYNLTYYKDVIFAIFQ